MKKQFTPIQPTIKNSNHQASYFELLPDQRLQEYIYCYWQLKSKGKLITPYNYRVVADTCMDILWEAQNPEANFIIGYSSTFSQFPLNSPFNYFGIRFLPMAFPIIFKVDASEISKQFLPLVDVVSNLSKKITEISNQENTLDHLKNKLDEFFLQSIYQSKLNLDTRISTALNKIILSNGNLSLEKDLDVGLSPRQLRRLFKFYIGDSPKNFSKIIRFQAFLKQLSYQENLRKHKVYYDFGYYDQAHFIKEFKQMYGLSPSSFFRN